MIDPKDFLPMPPWKGPPIPRGWLKVNNGEVPIGLRTWQSALAAVEMELGPFKKKPKLLLLPREEWEPAKVIFVDRYESVIYYAPNFMPTDETVQKRLLLHELSELRYDELGEEDIHDLADQFGEKYSPKYGAASEKQTLEALIERGCGWARISLREISQLRQIIDREEER